MTELNDPQRDAVVHGAGPLLVFAGAGSGKTRVITYRIAHLLAEHRIAPYKILAVTFTNKAAGEMRHRVEQIAGADITRDLWIGTFHATCARMLRRYHESVGLARSFVIYDDSDQKAVMGRLLKARNLSDREYPPKQVLGKIHRKKREGFRPGEVEPNHAFDETLVELWSDYEKAMTLASAVDFEDLILHVMRLAEDPNSTAGRELRERFSHVLVDEFQDTNRVQYRLVRALAAAQRNLCVVGDDDQSIYSWRGASVHNILGFRKDFPDAQVVKLEQNYRSTGHIVRAALAVIECAKEREPKRLWSAAEDGEPVRVVELADERAEAAFVVRTLKESNQAGTPYPEMAVFYRVHAQSRVLEEALRAEGIAYQIIGGMKFFERAEVKSLVAYLRLIHNPRSDADLVRVINVPTRGIGDKTVERLLATAMERSTSAFDAIPHAIESGAVRGASAQKLAAFEKLITDLRASLTTTSISDLATRVLDETGFRDALDNDDTAESDARLENLAELLGSIREFEADAEQSGDPPTLESYLERVALVADVDGLKENQGVALMTVHGAKGLEFSTVLLTGMEEETFPYQGMDGSSPEELDEERRLAYVAITRARRQLVVTHASIRTLFGRTRYSLPSRFLADLPKEGVTRVAAASRQPAAPRFGNSRGFGVRPAWSQARPAAQRPAPAAAKGGRHVDYEAFDDLAHERGAAVQPGSRVFHQRFGEGIVRRVENGTAPAVVANFPGFGERKVLVEFLTFGER